MKNEIKARVNKAGRWRRRLFVLLFAPFEYLWKFRWKKQWTRAQFVQSVWGSGWLGRAIFVLLLALAVYAPFAGSWHDTSLLQNAGAGLAVSALFLVAWSLAVAALASSKMWLYCLGSTFLGMISMTLLLGMHRTIFNVLPLVILWMIAAAKMLRPLPGERWSPVWFLFFSYWCGWIFSGPSGIRILILGGGSDPDFILRMQNLFGWAGATTGFIWVAFVYWRSKKHALSSPPHFGFVWIAALLSFSLSYALSWQRNAEETSQSLLDHVEQLGYVSAYFFVWIGGGYAAGGQRLADWWTRKVVHTLSPSPALWLFFITLIAVTAVEACIGYTESVPWLTKALRFSSWPSEWYLNAGIIKSMSWHFWISAICLGWLLVEWYRVGSGRWMTRLALWWLTLYLLATGFWTQVTSALNKYSTTEPSVFAGLAGLIFLLGLVWESGNLGKEKTPTPQHVWRQLAWISVLLALTIILQSTNHGFPFVQAQALASGIFHLGLIRIWYAWRTKGLPVAATLGVGQQVGWFFAGILAAHPALIWHPVGQTGLLVLFPLILAALYSFRFWHPALPAVSLQQAGTLTAAGALFQCYNRSLPAFPPNPWLPDWFLRSDTMTGYEMPPFDISHIVWLLIMMALGTAAGWCASRIPLPNRPVLAP